jgi:hypothetical protein
MRLSHVVVMCATLADLVHSSKRTKHGTCSNPFSCGESWNSDLATAVLGEGPLQLQLTGTQLPNTKFAVPLVVHEGVWIFSLRQCREGLFTRFAVTARLYSRSFEMLREAAVPELDSHNQSYLVWHARRVRGASAAPDRSQHLLADLLVERKSVGTKSMQSVHMRVALQLGRQKLRVLRMEPLDAPGEASRGELGRLLFYPPTPQMRLSSTITKDPTRPHDYRGKYLFAFRVNDTETTPTFDAHLDYATDKGQLLHWIKAEAGGPGRFRVVLSVRTMPHGDGVSVYSLYQATTTDFVAFTQTQPLTVVASKRASKHDAPSRWYCYPQFFERDGRIFAIVNQDDFGKAKPALVASVVAARRHLRDDGVAQSRIAMDSKMLKPSVFQSGHNWPCHNLAKPPQLGAHGPTGQRMLDYTRRNNPAAGRLLPRRREGCA